MELLEAILANNLKLPLHILSMLIDAASTDAGGDSSERAVQLCIDEVKKIEMDPEMWTICCRAAIKRGDLASASRYRLIP